MLGLKVGAKAVTVAGDRADQALVTAGFLEQRDALFAVLVRPLFKVDVVKKADDSPEIGFFAVAKLVLPCGA